MELPNVNNLNGIPNFGHGFTPEVEETEPSEVEEETPRKKGRKLSEE